MSEFGERVIRPDMLARTGRDMAGETWFLTRYLLPHDKSLRTKYQELAKSTGFESSDLETMEQLTAGTVPDAFYHNGATADYDLSGKRFQRGLSEDLIRGVEFDSQWCLGYLMAAHGHGTITTQWLLGNLSLRESQLPNVLARASGQFDRYNFDLKMHHPENVRDFIELVKTLPDDVDVFVSSPNWQAIKQVDESDIDRNLTLLYTVNNETRGTTQDAFLEMVKKGNLENSDNRRYGVSLRSQIANPWFMEQLKKRDFYSLLYPVDSNSELMRAVALGADGVTSNNPKILQLAELAKRSSENEKKPLTGEELELVIGKDSYTENQRIKLSDGRNLGFAEYGDPNGEPLFFFHGWPNSRLQAKILDGDAKRLGIRIVAPDRPGYGLSDPKPGRTLLDWPADVVELADHLGVGKFSVLGNSGGGPYAAAVAKEIPERLKNVGIVVGLAPINIETTQNMPLLNKLGWNKYRRFPHASRMASRLYSSHLPGSIDKALLSKSEKAAVATREAYSERHRVRKEAFRQGVEGPAADLRIYSNDWEFNLKDISMPLNLWYGEDDKTVPLAMGKFYESQIPDSKLKTFPDEGHYVLRTHPGEILEELK